METSFVADPMYDRLPVRPSQAIQRMYSVLCSSGIPFTLPAGQLLGDTQDKSELGLRFFTGGMFSVFRKADHLQMMSSQATASAMSLFGLNEILLDEPLFILRAETDCDGFFVPAACFLALKEPVSFWVDVALVQAYILRFALVRDQQLVGIPSYNIIRHQLIALIAYPEDVRKKINVQTFISQRSRLSRSNILKILNELQAGEFITLKRGKLVELKYLPLKF